jgi:hypothetical protein
MAKLSQLTTPGLAWTLGMRQANHVTFPDKNIEIQKLEGFIADSLR